MGWFNWFKRNTPAPITSAAKAKVRLMDCPAPVRRAEMTEAGIALVAASEGCELAVYKCSAGVPTQGKGATIGLDGCRITMDAKPITLAEAETLFDRDIKKFSDQVRQLVTVTVNDNQFSALVSLAYNIGTGAFGRSTLLRRLNSEDYDGAAAQFAVWRMAGGKVSKGLVRRRALERQLFLS